MKKVDIFRAKVDKLVTMLTRSDIEVRQIGATACTEYDDDGNVTRITIPSFSDDADDELLDATEGYIDHEVAHALFTDGKLVVKHAKEPWLGLFNMVEDVYIEREMVKEFKGTSMNLRNVLNYVLKHHTEPSIAKAKENEELMSYFFFPLIRAYGGSEDCQRFLDTNEHFYKIAHVDELIGEYCREEIPKIKNSHDSVRIAKRIHELLGDLKFMEKDAEGSGTDLKKLMRKLKKQSLDDAMEKTISEQTLKDIKNKPRSFFILTREFDKVEPPPVNEKIQVSDFEEELGNTVSVMKRDLVRLIKAKTYSKNEFGKKQGRINQNSLSRFLTVGDERIFKKKVLGESFDVAVSLMIDCSGSMVDENKILIATQSALAFSQALTQVNITHEILGFTTNSEDEYEKIAESYRKKMKGVMFFRICGLTTHEIKTFKEPLSYKVKHRLATLGRTNGSFRNNVDNESVMIGIKRLMKTGKSRKIMIVFSDGKPVFPTDSHPHLLSFHLKSDLKEYKKYGVEVVGIGIRSEAVKEIYERSAVVNNVKDLPKILMSELKSLLLK